MPDISTEGSHYNVIDMEVVEFTHSFDNLKKRNS